jgi:hypothetical protein
MPEKAAAFAQYGVSLKNERWSLSGVAPNGEVVIALWTEEFDYQSVPPRYSNKNGTAIWRWVMSKGNRERIEHLRLAREKCGGRFRVVIVEGTAGSFPRIVREAHPRPGMRMILTEFNEATGEFVATVDSSPPNQPKAVDFLCDM